MTHCLLILLAAAFIGPSCETERAFMFPVVIFVSKSLTHCRSLWVLGQCHVTSVCCETRVGGSRDGLTLHFFLFFCLVSKFLLPGGREGESREGGDAGRSPSLCFEAEGRWKAFLP